MTDDTNRPCPKFDHLPEGTMELISGLLADWITEDMEKFVVNQRASGDPRNLADKVEAAIPEVRRKILAGRPSY